MIKIILLITVVGLVQCGPTKLGKSRVPRDLRIILTFPGTKWCGAGTTSNDYYDLGSAWEEDQCCREHDFCSDYILPHKRKHDLYNDSSYTRSSCDCDLKFYRCLKELDSYTAYFIGKLYFNIFDPLCFKKEYKCLTSNSSTKCKDFQKDYTKPQKYQWFITPSF